MDIRPVRVARRVGTILVTLLLVLLASTLRGQATTGKLEGRAVDLGDQPVTMARIDVTSPALQGTREAVTSARAGHIEFQGEQRWLVLAQGQRNETDAANGEKTIARFEGYRIQAGERALQRTQERPPKALRTIDLLRQPTAAGQGELAWRMGLLFGAANLLVLGIGLSAASPRRASNWNLLFALLAFVVYYNLINLGQSWIERGQASFGLFLLVLHGGVLVVGLAWLAKQHNNWTFRQLLRRGVRIKGAA